MLYSSCKSCKKDDASGIPVLTTTEITEISPKTAVSGGNIIDDGGAFVTTRGVCWSTKQNPAINNSKTVDGNGAGSFTSHITGIEPDITYYVRAYATNSEGTGYGSNLPLTTQKSVVDADGNVYQIITIGTQIWMAENLKTTTYNDGIIIPLDEVWHYPTSPAYCWYKNDESNYKATYGALYNWYAINTGKLCPIGWHVPTDAEWTTLTTYLGGESVAGGKLKETGTLIWLDPNTEATNETGFTGFPGGSINTDGAFSDIGIEGNWWSASEADNNTAWSRSLKYDASIVKKNFYDKTLGFSIRCVKD